MSVVIHADPPNRADVEDRFGPLPDGTIFSYAPHIYVPSGVELTPWLSAHESVHLLQQGDDPGAWWDRYISDDDFRLDQEVEAHREEWTVAQAMIRDRNRRARGKITIAKRLAGPMYGNMVTTREALHLIGSTP